MPRRFRGRFFYGSDTATAYNAAARLYERAANADNDKQPGIAKIYREAAEYQEKRAKAIAAGEPEYRAELLDDISDGKAEIADCLDSANDAKNEGNKKAEEMYLNATKALEQDIAALIKEAETAA